MPFQIVRESDVINLEEISVFAGVSSILICDENIEEDLLIYI